MNIPTPKSECQPDLKGFLVKVLKVGLMVNAALSTEDINNLIADYCPNIEFLGIIVVPAYKDEKCKNPQNTLLLDLHAYCLGPEFERCLTKLESPPRASTLLAAALAYTCKTPECHCHEVCPT